MMMNMQSLNSSQALQNPGMVLFESMPEEINLRILSLVNLKTLGQCFFVSKTWNALAQYDQLWQPFARKLEITGTTGLKEACNTKLIQLIQVTKKVENVIAAITKGFEDDWETLFFHDEFGHHRAILELVKIGHKDTLLKAWDVHHQLLSLGLISIQKLDKIAEVLNTHYADVWFIWSYLAIAKIEQGDREGAINLMHTHLKDVYFERVKVNKSMLTDMCKKNQLHEAIEYFKAHCMEELNNMNYNKSSTIFDHCLEYKQFDVAQKYINEFETDNDKYLKFELIKAVLSEKQYDLAKGLIGKYYDPINDPQDVLSAIQWMDIFLKSGEISKASNIAHEWKNKSNFVIPSYKKKLLDNGFTKEAEKL